VLDDDNEDCDYADVDCDYDDENCNYDDEDCDYGGGCGYNDALQ
jgi:hypothetical protein